MSRSLIFSSLLLPLLAAPLLFAEPAYIVGFHALGESGGCSAAEWRGDTIFFNSNDQDAVVRLLHASNDGLRPGRPTTINIPSRTAVSLQDLWSPISGGASSAFWVNRVDVPSGVVVENRNEALELATICGPYGSTTTGKLSLPVFRELTPAGAEQVILGTDNGSRLGRINVSIYNGSLTAGADATIEVRRSCDGALMDSRTVTVPADTIIQVLGLSKGEGICRPPYNPYSSDVRHVLVRVSQPSFAFASIITDRKSRENGLAPSIEFAVPINYRF